MFLEPFSKENRLPQNKRLVLVTGALQVLIGIGAVPAGLGFILDPSGSKIGMSPEMLAGSPFADFLVPGIVLFLVNGIGSLAGAVLTLRRHAIAGKAAMGLGAFLMAWIVVQVWVLGPPLHWLQILYFVLGVVEFGLGWQIERE